VGNLWLAPYFGEPVTPAEYEQAVAALHDSKSEIRNPQSAIERRFFHWELEFPEVFFEARGLKPEEEGGFDAVIGNPPYIDIKGLERELTAYLFERYATARLRINVFASFVEQALRISESPCSGVSMIVPTAFLTQDSYADLRRLVLERYWLQSVVRLPNELFGQAAGEVKVDTCIIVIRPRPVSVERKTCVLIYDSFERANSISPATASRVLETPQRTWVDRHESAITFVEHLHANVAERMRHRSVPLVGCCEFCLGLTPYDKYSGHTEDQIKNKVFHANSRVDATYRRLLRSGDVARYAVEWNGQDWISYGHWLAAPRERRFFTEERILVQQIVDWTSLRLFAGWTQEELYNTQNQFNLLPRTGTNLMFVLAVLNSKLMSYYHRQVFLDVALQRFQKVLIKDAKTFPIRRIAFTTPSDQRARLVAEGKRLYDGMVAEMTGGENP